MALSVLFALLYIGFINTVTYRAFASDKRSAIADEQRIPEADLLYLAHIGGWSGAKFAQHRLRHKTRKQPFAHRLNVIGVLHVALVMTFLGVIGLLALVPAPGAVIAGTAQTTAAAQGLPPADGQLAISLRPPAGRPAEL